MKKNLLGAIVIFLLTFAFLLIVSDVFNENASEENTQQYYTDIIE